MNVEELREIAETLLRDIADTDMAGVLTKLREALAAQVNDPTNPEVQARVARARDAVGDALRSGATDEFNTRWRELLDEMGLAFLLPARLTAQLDEMFLRNQITPQVATTEISALLERVALASGRLTELVGAFDFLAIGTSVLEPGEFEAAVLIPRGEVDNALGALGREFQELETLIRPFVEAASGSPPPLEVRQIASSQFLAVVALAPGAAFLLSQAIDSVLGVYERVLTIRKLRNELGEAGLKPEVVEAIEANATEMVDQAIPDIVREVMEGAASLPDDGRVNEIEIAVTSSVKGIAKRVDHGFRMTVRAGPPVDEDESEDELDDEAGDSRLSINAIRELVVANQRRAEYHELAGMPILNELESPTGEEDLDPAG